jgi:Tfp pilus assembly protein PilF
MTLAFLVLFSAQDAEGLRLLKLGAGYASQGDHARATEPFEKACRLHPTISDACYFYGRNLYLLNRFEQAREVLLPLLDTDPAPWRIRNVLGLVQEARGDAADAERLYREAMQHAKGNPAEHPQVNLGVLLIRQARAAEAAKVLGQAPVSARQQFELARAFLETGADSQALVYLRRAVELDAEHYPAHMLLGKLYQRAGRQAESKIHLETARRGLTAQAR